MFSLLVGFVVVALAIAGIFVAAVVWAAFAMLRLIVRLAIAVIIMPVIVLALAAAFVVAGLGLLIAILVPLLPLAVVGLAIWLIVKLARHPARASAA
jgi:hypothetical protein